MAESVDADQVTEQEGLATTIGFWHLWAIGVGSVVGDGIFLLLGEGIARAGPAAIAGYAGAGLLMLCIALAISDLAVGLPSAGALWIWGREALGNYAGFMSGITYAGGWVIAAGSASLALGRVTEYFAPHFVSPVVWGMFFLTVFTLIQLAGSYLSSRIQLIVVSILVVIVAIFGVQTILNGDFSTARFSPFMPNGINSVAVTMALGVFAYVGPLTLTTAGDEVEDPTDIPKALVVSTLSVIIIYGLATVGMVGLMNYSEFSAINSPFTVVAQASWGRQAALISNFASWIAIFTTLFMGVLYSAPRMLFKMGQMKILPDIFGQVYERTRVPLFSTVFVWACGIILLLIAHFNLIDYSQLVVVATFIWLVSWTIAVIAGIKYRYDYPDYIKSQDWIQPAFPLFPILGLIGIVIAAWGTFKGEITSVITGIIAIILLSLVYLFYGRRRMENLNVPTVLTRTAGESDDD